MTGPAGSGAVDGTGAVARDGEADAPPGELRDLCIVLLSGLGDVVHGLPVVNALKRDDPTRRITWVVEPMSAPLLRPHPAVDDVVVFRRARGPRGVLDLARSLRGRRFDATLNLNVYFKSVFPTVLSGAPVRVGFDRSRSRDLTWLFATHRLPAAPRAHTQDMFLEFLDVLGVPRGTPEWRLGPTPAERRAQAAFFRRFDRPVAAVVPVSGVPAKDWPADRWAEVMDALGDRGLETMIVGGPSERERRVAEHIVGRTASDPVVALAEDVRTLAWRLHGSALVLGPDTGPIHVARAMGVPVIGLYGHTNPWRVGPYRAYEDLWVDAYTEPGEAPDPSRHRAKSDRMGRIAVADVLDRVERALARYPVRQAEAGRDAYLPAERERGGTHDG